MRTLALARLPPEARTYPKFDNSTVPLLTVKKLCAADLDVHFRKAGVAVTNDSGPNIVMDGKLAGLRHRPLQGCHRLLYHYH